MRNMAAIKTLALIVALAAVFTLVKFTSLGEVLTQSNLQNQIGALGALAPIGFVAVYAVATAFGVPATIFTVTGGALFGWMAGALLSALGATFGASGSFIMSRALAHDFMMEKFGRTPWFKKLDEGICNGGLFFIMFVRIVPIFPFSGTNFSAGLTKIKFRDYFLGTLLGVMPASFIFTYAADSFIKAAAGEFDPAIIISLSAMGVLALLPLFVKNWRASKVEEELGAIKK